MEEYTGLYKQLEKAVLRLEEVLGMDPTPVVRDSAIQRFEFCMDLAWKSVKKYLSWQKGIAVASPKEAFRQAFSQGIIAYDDAWIGYVDMRNETVHTYDEKTAEEIFTTLPDVLTHLKDLIGKIKPADVP